MSRQHIVYSLIKDESFTDLNIRKVRTLIAAGVGEMLGVAIFMFLGCGNVVANMTGADPSHLNTVLSFALGIVTSIIIFNPISGSVLNPALNFAAVILGHMSLIKLVYYSIFQLLGSVLGIALLRATMPEVPEAFCVLRPSPDISLMTAFAVEFVSTCILALVFCHVLDARMLKSQVHLIFVKFGLAIIAIALPVAKWTGCNMNPARILGPAVLANYWEAHWIYWVGPIAAAIFTSIFYRLLFEEIQPSESERKRNEAI